MNYPALELLLQAYLNLDWPDDYPDAWAAVDDFIANESIAVRLIEEVPAILNSVASEEALRHIVVTELGSGYLPEGDGLTMTEWLEGTLRHVREMLDG